MDTSQRTWAAYAAAIWAFAFAAVSAYWAAGGRAGVGTLSAEIAQRTDPAFLAVVWLTAVLKAAAGMLALALVRPWGRRLPRRLLLAAAWATGVLLTGYGGVGEAQVTLMLAGVLDRPPDADAVLRWYAFLWEPVWLLGGVLFLTAAWHYQRRVTPAVRNVGSSA